MAPPPIWVLWPLLLLGPSRGSPQTVWDSLSCTEVVTVPRGQPALMSCNVTSPLIHVVIHLRVPGKDPQLLFRVDAPGDFSSAGWRLLVHGGQAQLVIPDAQPSQAGQYSWYLAGRQGRTRQTRLEVS
ncbi:PREDICTED: secreted and transmembrane protein 1, partial [Condylura cristata]|uniref:secreted and transmembrane protein 1 n=1 Tax=Condylura cristata TaxID=143302 RepID=UPI00064326AB